MVCRAARWACHVELPQLSYVAPNFADNFVDSLRQYGFAAVVDHPLDSHRIERIYRDWLAFFASEEVSAFTMDPQSVRTATFRCNRRSTPKGFGTGTLKNIFSFIVGGAVPSTLRADLEAHFSAAVALGATLLGYIAHSLPASISAQLTEPLRDMIGGSRADHAASVALSAGPPTVSPCSERRPMRILIC